MLLHFKVAKLENDFWHKCWQQNTIGFHQPQVHPFLTNHFKSRSLPSDNHIFVPLCGKTLDMAYLARFMRVTGNELSAVACQDFFIENNIKYVQKNIDVFQQYACPQLTLFQGDYFQLSANLVGQVDWIYDRAALTALPPTMQQQYVNHLKSFFSPNTRLFLITLEFPIAQLSGPPFAITGDDVAQLFSGFNIECVADNVLQDKQFAQRRFNVDYLIEKLYIISLAN